MAGPGGILALDLSLSSGWGYGMLGERPSWGRWSLGKMADGHGVVCARLEDHIDDAIRLHRPRALVYEAPFISERQSNAATAFLLLGLATVAELIATRHEIQCHKFTSDQVRSKVLGKVPRGKAKIVKPIIMAWCRERGWDTHQDDEADALCLLQYACVALDRSGKVSFFRSGDKL
jgi:Holliday junction resolvasome RuvABC endonuclease subunit